MTFKQKKENETKTWQQHKTLSTPKHTHTPKRIENVNNEIVWLCLPVCLSVCAYMAAHHCQYLLKLAVHVKEV